MSVIFKLADWESDFTQSLNNGTGFLLDTSINYHDLLDREDVKEIKRIFSIDSIYSYKFGMSNQIDSEDHVLKRAYTCKCHSTYGKERVGETCNECNTKVRETIPFSVGWFDLVHERNSILHPYICKLLWGTERDVVTDRKTGATSISEESIDLLENPEDMDMEEAPKEKKKSKIKGVERERMSIAKLIDTGRIEYTWHDLLYGDKLFEFLEKYFKGTNASLLIDLLRQGGYKTTKINVLSAEYRPIKIDMKLGVVEITQDPLNNIYMDISNCIKTLLEDDEYMLTHQRIKYIVKIMKQLSEVYKINLSTLAGNKKATIRAEIVTKSFKNSLRLVSQPLVSKIICRIDACTIGIDAFRGVASKDILEILNNYDNLTPYQRARYVDIDTILTEEERDFIRYEIFPQIKFPIIYLIREPAIYKESVRFFQIVDLTDDEYNNGKPEMVLRTPFSVQPAFAGDFDGDAFGGIWWDDPDDRKRLVETVGIKNSVISTVDITYNHKIGPNNNTAVLLYQGFYSGCEIKEV